MKKTIFITTLFLIFPTILSGCMTTWPIVDDLDHYKKWETYDDIREKNNSEETIVENDIQEMTDNDIKAIENCIDSRNNDPLLHEDESIIEWHNQFENTESFCAEFVKTNPMYYNESIWIDESWQPVWWDWEIIENN